jgi:hypothetical protein
MHGLWKATYWFFALALLVLMAAGLLGAGCQRLQKASKHWDSGWEGLDRTISVYSEYGRWSDDGTPRPTSRPSPP